MRCATRAYSKGSISIIQAYIKNVTYSPENTVTQTSLCVSRFCAVPNCSTQAVLLATVFKNSATNSQISVLFIIQNTTCLTSWVLFSNLFYTSLKKFCFLSKTYCTMFCVPHIHTLSFLNICDFLFPGMYINLRYILTYANLCTTDISIHITE